MMESEMPSVATLEESSPKTLVSCGTCTHSKTCKMLQAAVDLEKEFNARFGDMVKFPFPAISIGQNCSEYKVERNDQ